MKIVAKVWYAIIFCALFAVIASFVPVIALYAKKVPTHFTKNADTVKKLEKNTGELFRFIVIGDSHAGLIFNDSAFLKMVGRINREDRFRKAKVDFVALMGDVSFRGSAWDYRSFNLLRSRIRYPVIAAIGNHDDDDDKSVTNERFAQYLGDREFAFADRNSYFIVIDNVGGDIDEAGFVRLEKELVKGSAYKHRFVMIHKPAISPYQQSWYRPELSPWAYRFTKLCEKYKVDMVFTGHEHMFKECNFGGVKYVTTGGGGIIPKLASWDGGYLHYVVVRVYHDYVDYEVRRVFPPLWEYVTYYAWKDLYHLLRNVLG